MLAPRDKVHVKAADHQDRLRGRHVSLPQFRHHGSVSVT
jgi:hypothetical protein